MPDYTTGDLVNGIGGIVFALLGLLVLLVRPRERANQAFGFFAVAFGARFAYRNLVWDERSALAEYALAYMTVLGILLLAFCLPKPPGSEARSRWIALAVATGPQIILIPGWIESLRNPMTHSALVSEGVVDCALAGLLVLLALRYRRFAGLDEDGARLQATLALAVGLWLGYEAGYLLVGAAQASTLEPPGPSMATGMLLTGVLPFLVAAFTWLAVQASSRSRVPRTVGWILLSTALLAALVSGPLGGPGDDPGFGISRIVGALILSYAILRHQMFGLERKARFTIKSTTLGTIFVVAFFVASEAAQQFFGERANSAYVGIAAAGALVFALAPLQRLAERVAAAAIPEDRGTSPTGSRAEVYRQTARRLLADGRLSPQDERILAKLAQELGIGAADALELRLSQQEGSATGGEARARRDAA